MQRSRLFWPSEEKEPNFGDSFVMSENTLKQTKHLCPLVTSLSFHAHEFSCQVEFSCH